MSYTDSKFLIYACWSTHRPEESTISGSLLLDSALTVEEAQEKTVMYKERAESYGAGDPHTTRRYIYINNRREWWPAAAKLTADLPVE